MSQRFPTLVDSSCLFALSRQDGLDRGDHVGRVRLGPRTEAPHDLAAGSDEELLEVPLDVAGLARGVRGLVSSAYSGCRLAPLTSVFANSGNVTP